MTPADSPRHPTTDRRRFLQLGGTALGLGALAACGDGSSSTPPTGTATSSPGGSGLAGGEVRVWTVSQGPEDEEFNVRMFDQFMADNPDVEVDLQLFPSGQYGNAMQLAFTGGEDAPDVFRFGPGASLPDAYAKGWVASIEEFITDEFRSRFPEWAYDPAISPLYREGEAMAVPRPDPAVQAIRVMFCNADLLEAAGLSAPPATWSEFREAASKITADGGGQAYGSAIIGSTSPHLLMQSLAGPQSYRSHDWPQLSLLTGAPAMSEPSLVETVELWQALHRNQILTPGWESWDGTLAIQQMASGRLGMYFAPLFHAFQLRAANPDLPLVLAPPPEPDTGRAGSVAPNNSAPHWMMSSTARNREASWRVLDFYGSVQYQQAALQEMQDITIMPAAYEGVEVDPDITRLREIAEDIVRVSPDPTIGNDAAGNFYAELIAQAPKPLDIYFEAVTRDTDFAAAAAQFDEQLQTLIDQTLPDFPDVSMDDFTFPDWDPLEDYA